MNKKVLEAFAREIANWRKEYYDGKEDAVVQHYQHKFMLSVIAVAKKFNPRFDEAKFRKACEK